MSESETMAVDCGTKRPFLLPRSQFEPWPHDNDMVPYDHLKRSIAVLYARMSLHIYNLLRVDTMELDRLVWCKYPSAPPTTGYDIAFDAKDRADSSLVLPFRIKLSEEAYGKLILTCPPARPLWGTTELILPSNLILSNYMPELPSQSPFQNTNRFYVLEKSEVQDNEWIRLYLELAVATTNRNYSTDPLKTLEVRDVSKLEILQVATESCAREKLGKASNAVFYIRYKDLVEKKQDVDRIALVRRLFYDGRRRRFTFVGQILSSEKMDPNPSLVALNQSSETIITPLVGN